MSILPLVWAGILGFAVIMYVLLDGFDLGIGILFPWTPDHTHRDIMMNTVAPVWDGNETWMVLGGALLYGAFPLAYSTLMPIIYLPILTMSGALIFRGVAFEFRFKAVKSRFLWDIAFWLGSTIAAFCQGLILGTFVHGYTGIAENHPWSHSFIWFSPFSVMTGIAVIIGYALLGATWLIIKTEHELQKKMFHAAKILLATIVFFLVLVSAWTPFVDQALMQRWFSIPNVYYLAALPLLTASAIIYCAYGLFKRYEKIPFLMSVALFGCSYLGFCISVWPYLVPRTITIWQAAADTKSLVFLLVGTVILLPMLLAYSIYAYYIFKGKVKAEHGYH